MTPTDENEVLICRAEFKLALSRVKVYIKALVPRYGMEDFERGAYAPWYVGHFDEEALTQERITRLARVFVRENGEDEVETFVSFLEEKGYLCFNTSVPDNQDDRWDVLIAETD